MGFVLDVAGYGARAAQQRIEVERRLPTLVSQTLGACGLDLGSVGHRWTGDGISVVLPAGIDQSVVLPTLIRSLAAALGADNGRYEDRIRVRMGAALGLVEQNATGFVGPLVVDASRLVASEPLRSALASYGSAEVAVAVSGQLFDAVIRPGYPGIPRGQFSRVDVVEKEFTGSAWIWVSARQWSGPACPPLLPGDLRQAGPYRLLARLGQGPASVVYLGRDASAPWGGRGAGIDPGRDGGWTAVKVFDRALTGDSGADAARRLAVGAVAAGVLRGPNLAHVLDAETEVRPAWAAATFVPGPSLAAVVTETGPLPATAAGWLALGIARGLATLHAAGLSHGSVTPHNVLLAADGPVLTDFGVNRATLAAGPAPAADDIAQLGSTVCYAATGRTTWRDRAAGGAADRAPETEPPDLAGCPASLIAVLTACLSADPAQRPAAPALVGWLAKVAGPQPRGWLPGSVASRLAEYQALPSAAAPSNGVRFWSLRRHER